MIRNLVKPRLIIDNIWNELMMYTRNVGSRLHRKTKEHLVSSDLQQTIILFQQTFAHTDNHQWWWWWSGSQPRYHSWGSNSLV